MKLHLLGLPHTYTHPRFSCCAFTGKALRFAPMMQAQGMHVIHYGNAGSISGANEEVEILNARDYQLLGGCEPSNTQYGTSANVATPLYQQFNCRLYNELEDRVQPGDIICLPFGTAHMQALTGPRCKQAYWVETGIGYRRAFAPYRIYESTAWMNVHYGRENPDGVAMGNDYWWVIPNYYDPADWRLSEDYDRRIVFLGRLNDDKGLRVIEEAAKRRPKIQFQICGQGDPAQLLKLDNIKYVPPIHDGNGAHLRADYLGSAAAVIVPSRYVEPFGGVAAEALLCGVPVMASAFGAFPEYIRHGENGWLCRTLSDWLDAIDEAVDDGPLWTRREIQDTAQNAFSMWEVGKQYAKAFEQISNLGKGGWYSGTE